MVFTLFLVLLAVVAAVGLARPGRAPRERHRGGTGWSGSGSADGGGWSGGWGGDGGGGCDSGGGGGGGD